MNTIPIQVIKQIFSRCESTLQIKRESKSIQLT